MRPSRALAAVALAAFVAASCSSGSSPSTSTTSPEGRARAERRAEREEARERDEERAEREAERLQEELSALPPDLDPSAALLTLQELPPDFPVGPEATGDGFDAALSEQGPTDPPELCSASEIVTTDYAALPAEDYEGRIVVSPAGDASLVHVVARLDGVPQLWQNFSSVVNFCTSSFDGVAEGQPGISLERSRPFRYGRVIGVGYRQLVALEGAPPTLYARYLMRNGRCVSDIVQAAQPVEAGQYAMSGEILLAAAARLNRVVGCELPASD